MLVGLVTGDIIFELKDVPEGYTDQDQPVGTVVNIPDELSSLPAARLRYDGNNVVDIANYTTFYIDDAGTKHILQLDQNWVQLQCNYDDNLVPDAEHGWRVVTPNDYLQFHKNEMLQYLDQKNREFLEEHYPTIKLLGYFKLKIYYEQLKASGTLTDNQLNDINSKLAKIEQVDNWINQVMQSYYSLEAQLQQISSVDDLPQFHQQIDSTYTTLDQSDPHITYAEVL